VERTYKPPGYTSVSAYIIAENARHVIDFLIKTFAAQPLRRKERPDGTILHAEVWIDDTVVMIADGGAGFPAFPISLHVYVPDVVQQQAGFLGVMERKSENGNEPVLFSIRLKLEDGEITEAEHLVAAVNANNIQRLQTPRPGLISQVPAESRQDYDDLVSIGLSYYDALDDNDGSLMPFADDCQRHENGMITAGPQAGGGPNADPNRAPVARMCGPQLDSQSFIYIDRIENRRLVAADPVTGLALGFSHFRHPFDNLPYEVMHTDGSTSERNADNMPFDPFDMPAAHVFKIGADGLVHEIEAIGFTAPYNSPTGWE